MIIKKRFRRANEMSNVAHFLRKWDDPSDLGNASIDKFYVSTSGNIASTAVPGACVGHAVSQYQANFEECIEPGIRKLVLIFVQIFGWVTYSSCEGHNYGMERDSSERYVGLLPRSQSELREIYRTVKRWETLCLDFSPAAKMEGVVHRLSSNGTSKIVIDVVFLKENNMSWKEYFMQIDFLYEKCVAVLRDEIAHDRN